MNLRPLLLLAFLGLGACSAYSGVTKVGDQLYISGGTNYVFFTKAWVKRCTVDGVLLTCEELSESPKAAGGQGAPASTVPAATPAPAPSGSAAP